MPRSARQSLELATQHFARQDFRAAHDACMDALRVDAQSPEAYFLLGALAGAHGNHRKAVEVMMRAVRLAPDEPRYHAHVAKSLLALNRHNDARLAIDEAIRLAPADALTCDTVGVVLARLGAHPEALPFFQRACQATPGNPSYWYNLGSAHQFAGDFAAAQRAYEQAIARDARHFKAHSALSGLRKQTAADNHVATLESLFASLRADESEARLHIGHALAKEYEDLGEFDAAFDWLRRAKTSKAAALHHDKLSDAELFHAARATTPITACPASSGPTPIFVVGMPRTGTTLIDRILSSHSEIASLGELTQFALLVKRAAATPSRMVLDAETLGRSARLDMPELGRAYLQATADLRGGGACFIDKMPLNFFYCALLIAAVPNARVIAVRRQPGDTVLSNYRQLFATSFSYYNYAYDLADTVHYYGEYNRLLQHWRSQLPGNQFIEVNYESVVADLPGETARLLSFVGMDWQDACLTFHENAAPVATASSVQVRQPLYATSVGRWRRWPKARKLLEELINATRLPD